MTGAQKRLYLFLITLSFLASDQVTKYLVRINLERVGGVAVLGDFFRLHLVYNYHGIFGLSFGDGVLVRYLLPILGIGFAIYLSLTAKSLFSLFAYGLILGGALGNIFDRIFFGKVTDFIDIGIGRWRWYVFNLADAFLVIGIFLTILTGRRKR